MQAPPSGPRPVGAVRSARHPLKVETAGSNPAQRIPCHRGREVAGTCLPSRRRGFESLRWLQDRSPSLPFPEVVRLVEDTVSKTAGGRKASRGFESLRLRRMTLGVIGSPPDSGSGNRGSNPRSGAACARGGTGRRAALRARGPKAVGVRAPPGAPSRAGRPAPCGRSSPGRTPARQAGGSRFEPGRPHLPA